MKIKKFKYRFLCSFLLIISLLSGCNKNTSQELIEQVSQGVEYLSEMEDTLITETEDLISIEPKDTIIAEPEHSILPESEDTLITESETPKEDSSSNLPDPDGSYTSKEEVALYLHEYGELPSNFITKNEAKNLGWISKEGNLSKVAPGKSIGGDRFWNNEEILPEKEGRKYYECDINSDGGYRGAERIVYSNDGLIYYTSDHYETFQLLYGSLEEKEP